MIVAARSKERPFACPVLLKALVAQPVVICAADEIIAFVTALPVAGAMLAAVAGD